MSDIYLVCSHDSRDRIRNVPSTMHVKGSFHIIRRPILIILVHSKLKETHRRGTNRFFTPAIRFENLTMFHIKHIRGETFPSGKCITDSLYQKIKSIFIHSGYSTTFELCMCLCSSVGVRVLIFENVQVCIRALTLENVIET